MMIWERIDLENPAYFSIYLEEYRVELHDDRFNFMGISKPETFNYLNAESHNIQRWPNGI